MPEDNDADIDDLDHILDPPVEELNFDLDYYKTWDEDLLSETQPCRSRDDEGEAERREGVECPASLVASMRWSCRTSLE
jgi:hypothetical protein